MTKEKEKIYALVRDENYKPMKRREMAFFMSVSEDEKEIFDKALDELEKECKIYITGKGRIKLPEKANVFVGNFRIVNHSYGIVSFEDDSRSSVYIKTKHMNNAMHMDTVQVQIFSGTDGARPEGEIIRVVKRGLERLVGTFKSVRKDGIVVPDDKKLPLEIHISGENTGGAVDGHKVLVEITKFSLDASWLLGRVIKIIGHKNDPGTDVLSILYGHEIPVEYPVEVIEESEKTPVEVTPEECDGRRDLTNEILVTVDGEDTKDIDDAVSIDRLENGHYRLGVHIADVTAYVPENSLIDKEALLRGTSVYLLDTVVPMLPHRLSNGICSLNEGVHRLALSCSMEIDERGVVVDHEIFTSVVMIKKRMTYNMVDEVLNGAVDDSYEPYTDMIKQLHDLSEILRQKRFNRGAIDFDLKESKIILDEYGKPVDIKATGRTPATGIIEECMIVCNETVAERYFWMDTPFVYRCHEEPEKERLRRLMDSIGQFGYSLRGGKGNSKSIQALLQKADCTPEEAIINRIVLQSMKQARYTPDNIGHFGLASQCYCHFTSPIRRYPDLQIHRIIKEELNGGLIEKREAHYRRILTTVCRDSSKTERRAEEAEREADSLKKVEYMADKVGQTFDGIISGVTSWGLYVALENTVEGLVHISSISDDYYIFDEVRMCLIGERKRKAYVLGQKVRIIVARANIEERRLDFELY